MVKFGGRLARTTWALTAVWLGDGHWAVAASAFSDFAARAAAPSTTCLLGRMAVSGLGYDRGAAGIKAYIAPAKTWTASIGLAQTSPSHWLRVAGVLIAMMIAGAGWTQTDARSPRKDPPK